MWVVLTYLLEYRQLYGWQLLYKFLFPLAALRLLGFLVLAGYQLRCCCLVSSSFGLLDCTYY